MRLSTPEIIDVAVVEQVESTVSVYPFHILIAVLVLLAQTFGLDRPDFEIVSLALVFRWYTHIVAILQR